jgi:hypothetical protein
MAELKTRPTAASVAAFIDSITDDTRREDCRTVLRLMKNATRAQPRMWGPSIVGFGSYHYTYDSGREGDWFEAGFSPRKNDLTLYLMSGLDPLAGLLATLGRHKTGKSCLYIKRLADVNLEVLEETIVASVKYRKIGEDTKP